MKAYFAIDGRPIDLAGWSFSSQADLGYDQFRAFGANSRARRMIGGIDQGSVVQGFTEAGRLVWEGTVSQPPKLAQDGLASIAAQGHGYRAAKSGNRITPILTQPGAWVAANLPPLNYPTTSTMSLTTTSTQLVRRFEVTLGTQGQDWAVAFWSPGTTLTRLRFTVVQGTVLNEQYRIMSADGPDIGRTWRMERVITTWANPETFDTTFATPGDAIILQRYDTSAFVGSGHIIQDPVIYGDFPLAAIYSHHAAQIVASQLGWDPIGITGRGCAPLTSMDWTGDGASFLSYAAGLEDFCWGAWADEGAGPVLSFDAYGAGGRVWEVSAATGARWDLDPLERIRTVVVQFLSVDNSVNEIRIEAPPDALDADTELKGSLNDSQSDIGLALASGGKLLRRFLAQRWRGRITFGHAREKDTGRDAPFEVRAGDLIRIVDFAMDGSITLRVHDVDCSADGVTVGVEAAALPLGGAITGTSGSNVAAVGLGPQLTQVTGGTTTYIPPGSGAGNNGELPTGGGGIKGPATPWHPR